MEKVIAIVSGKGGVGKTWMATNMGVMLAEGGKRVMILDLNFQARGVDIALGLESKVIYDIVDVLSGVCRLKQATIKCRRFDGLCIMEPPLAKEHYRVGPIEIKVLCERLSADFDVIILDMAAGAGETFEGIVSLAERVMVVTTQDPISIRSTESVLKKLDKRDVRIKKLFINQVKMKLTDRGYLMGIEDITENLGVELCGIMPYDDHIYVAFANGNPIVCRDDSHAGAHLRKIVQKFLDIEEA